MSNQERTAKEQTASPDVRLGTRPILDTLVAIGTFEKLIAAMRAAGLEYLLQGPDLITLFAPTDQAFSQLPPGKLDDLLKPENSDELESMLSLHVVKGRVTSSDLRIASSVKTLQGAVVQVRREGGNVRIDKAIIERADIPCTNGILHAIDMLMGLRAGTLAA